VVPPAAPPFHREDGLIRAVVFFLCVLGAVPASLFCALPPQQVRIVLNDSLISDCQCPKTQLDCGALEKYLKQHGRGQVAERTRNVLDSLGFFHAGWDTAAPKRFVITPGIRSVVVAESLAVPFAVDSLDPLPLPRVYDAGEISGRIAQIGRRLARKGYPFATIAVSIAQRPSTGIASPYSLRVVYHIRPDQLCYFTEPRLAGARSTKSTLLLYDVLVRRGQLFDARKIEETLVRLNRRSYIESAETGPIAVKPETVREAGDSLVPRDAYFVVVPFRLKDRSGLGVDGALGYTSREGETTPLQGDVTLSFLNVFHAGENASLIYAGDRSYQKFHCEASKPWLFGSPISANAAFGLEIQDSSYGFLNGELTSTLEIRDNWLAGFSAKGTETTTDSAAWKYYGADFLIALQRQRLADGMKSSEFSLATGGGVSFRDRNYGRSHVDFAAGIHLPLWRHQAFHARVISKHIITNEQDLVTAEIYRIGGYRSARGYPDNQFAFRTVAYSQLEYMLYFNSTGSVYPFADGGFGFENSLSLSRWNDRREFLGYGIGIRIPAGIGTLTLEWARNIDDTKSLGRIHVRVQNVLAGEGD
jgi:outer membrane protein assembly factor BamA